MHPYCPKLAIEHFPYSGGVSCVYLTTTDEVLIKTAYYTNGKMRWRLSFKNGVLHRDDNKAAEIHYFPNGDVKSQTWYKHGRPYREDGPFYIEYRMNGELSVETWEKNRKLHRLDGPAHTRYNRCCASYIKEWYVNGNFIDKLMLIRYYRYLLQKIMKSINEKGLHAMIADYVIE